MGVRGGLAGGVKRGEVRWYRFAAPDKQRPVLVLTRDSSLGVLATATVAPVTSSVRGVRSEVLLTEADGMRQPCAVNLHGAVTVRQRLLGTCIARLSPQRMAEVCAALGFALGCDSA